MRPTIPGIQVNMEICVSFATVSAFASLCFVFKDDDYDGKIWEIKPTINHQRQIKTPIIFPNKKQHKTVEPRMLGT